MININFRDFKQDAKEVLENIEDRLKKTSNILNNQQELGYVEPKEEPNIDYEKIRRRIGNNIQEMWYFFKSELLKVQKRAQDTAPDLVQQINNVIALGNQHRR